MYRIKKQLLKITLQKKKKQIKQHRRLNVCLNYINCTLNTAIKQFLREIHQAFCVPLPTIMLTRRIQTLLKLVYCRSTHPPAFMRLAFWCAATRMLQEIQQPSCDKSHINPSGFKNVHVIINVRSIYQRHIYLCLCMLEGNLRNSKKEHFCWNDTT